MSNGQLILAAGSLLAAGLALSLLAGRVRLPSLLLFLGLGMAIGSDGTGWIDFNDYDLTRRIGIIALALILFEGGLATGFGEIRSVMRASISLAIVGTITTAVIAGLVASWLFDFSTLEGLLVGSILASTDGAAIFALLRGSQLKRRIAHTLEGEAGFNDPIAILLVLGFIDWIQKPDYGLTNMVGLFASEIAVGAAAGVAIGWLAVQAFERVQLATPGLYPVASIAAAALAFGIADVAHGSGFLAVYLAGLTLGSGNIPAKRTIEAFHDGLAWIAQIAMFFALGLLVFPSELGDVAAEGTLLAFVIVLIARPAGAFLSTAFERFSNRERAVIGWAGLRGAVPVVLATFPVIDGVPRSDEFFNIAFFAVVVSTLIQGSTVEPLARFLRVTSDEPALPGALVETGRVRRLGADVLEWRVKESDAIVGHRVRDLDLPRDALVNLIVRDGEAIPPRGSTGIEADDELHILVRGEVMPELAALRQRWRDGPIGPPERTRMAPRGHPAVFSVRPWDESHGDPGRPEQLLGVEVIEHLRTRRDTVGALVMLADGRYAVTGPLLAVGGAGPLQAHARTRVIRAASDAEKAWWQEVIGALAY